MAKKPKGFIAFDKLARKLVKVPPAELKPCPICDGKGWFRNTRPCGPLTCTECRGTGKVKRGWLLT